LARENKLDILGISSVARLRSCADMRVVNNAGMLASPYAETPEGISTAIAANHLGPFTFTTTLLPVLESTAKLPGSDVRVINVRHRPAWRRLY
jgi:NAD(P)-dependent dehydrogenase (short-subunit alcohol dehydrogenase family)